MHLISVIAVGGFMLLWGCNSLRSKQEEPGSQAQFTGVVGTCSIEKVDLQVDLCLEYSYSSRSGSSPQASANDELSSKCSQATPAGKWVTEGRCSLEKISWKCSAKVAEGDNTAFLMMTINGQGATKLNAQTLCDAYNGTLEAVDASHSGSGTPTNGIGDKICSRDLGRGYVSYEIAAPSNAKVERWFIKSGVPLHDAYDRNARFDSEVSRWVDGFYVNNFAMTDSVVYSVDGRQIQSSIADLINNRCK